MFACCRALSTVLRNAVVVPRVKQLKNLSKVAVQTRSFQTSKQCCNSYDGDGKTTVSDLADQIGQYIIVKSFNSNGFSLSNGGFAVGPLILFPNVFLSWKIKGIEDITEESLTVFKIVEPKLDLLILGLGDPGQYSAKEIAQLKREIQKTGINVEIQPTKNAIATYNFMMADFRVVAGAFLPPLSDMDSRFLKLDIQKEGSK